MILPAEPLFVDRVRELAEFNSLISDLAKGRRRHFALLGLRRIGKTLLLDEVRRRHLTSAISYIALDEVVSTPEDFARAFVSEILKAAAVSIGRRPIRSQTDDALREAAVILHPSLPAQMGELLSLIQQGSYGGLLTAVMRFPAHVSEALELPILVMLDEFQEIVRLQTFAGTQNLLGTIRAALDRPGKVAYTVAGSRVTALRNIIGDSESPLFTRFEQIELHPFGLEATGDLATRIWDDEEVSYEPDAIVRLYKIAAGWPFYVQAVAIRAHQMARAGHGKINPDLIDVAFQQELFGRSASVGQQCRYLLETAISTEAATMRNALESVLRQVAHWQPMTRANLVRRLGRHYSRDAIYRAINRLIDTDFVCEEQGVLTLPDPVFALWLNLEPERRSPDTLTHGSEVIKRLIAQYEARHAEDREEMGTLFERRIENLVRQFRGQTVEGRLFGVAGDLVLPVVREAGKVRVQDLEGEYGDGPDTYEVDVVTMGDRSEDTWVIEAKHRRGAITKVMVERFIRNAKAVAKARGLRDVRLWMVAPKGIRPDAAALAHSEGILTSGLRSLERLERILAASFGKVLPT